MTWITTIPPAEATGRLKALYERIAGAGGQIDNILRAHALRPHTLEGHMALYKAVLHHAGNRLPEWILETVGVAVSRANGCAYCVEHHRAGLAGLLDDPGRVDAIVASIEADRPEAALENPALAAVRYALKLTRAPADIAEEDIAGLRSAGLEDGEILEVNQVAAYFAYANRTVLGLGVESGSERLGLAPRRADDPADWRHR